MTARKELAPPRLGLAQAALLWGIGVYLRLPMLLVAALVPQLSTAYSLTTAQLNMLLTLPLVLLGAGALLSAHILRHLSPKQAVALGLVVVGLGSAARSFMPDFTLLLACTATFGLGVALLQVTLPAWVRSQRLEVARATALYTNGLLVGELLVTASTPLLAQAMGPDWNMLFLLWTLPLAGVLLAFVRQRQREHTAAPPPVAPLAGSAGAWRAGLRLGTLMSGSAAMYFAANAYLPRALEASGRAALIAPGLGLLNGAQLFASAGLIWLGSRALRGASVLIGFALCALVGLVGLALAPAAWMLIVFAGLGGFGTAGMLTLILARATHTGDPEVSRQVVTLTLFIGYTLAFVLPSVGGWLADFSGRPAAALLPPLLVGTAGCLLLGAEALHRRRVKAQTG